MISFEESIHLLAGLAVPLAEEDVALDDADGHVLANPIVANRSAPAFAVSAMDGYAVRDQDLHTLPLALKVAGKSFAGGGLPRALEAGTCVRVFTGAVVPEGADRVVVQEDVITENSCARFHLPLGNSRHLRAAGSDFAKGDVLVPAGVELNPPRLVAVAAADVARVSVIRRPRVAIIANGDELKPPGSIDAAGHRIPDSLTIALSALIRRWNGIISSRRICPDDLDLLRRAASQAIGQADVVVVTGGASVGERDFAKTMFAQHELQLTFSKVAIRPGKPVWLGTVGDTIVLGLPGNPTSAFVTARLYLAPLLAGLAGFNPSTAWAWRALPLAAPIDATGERHTFLRAKSSSNGVEALSNQDSSAQKALAAAEFLIQRPPRSPRAEAGISVNVLPL